MTWKLSLALTATLAIIVFSYVAYANSFQIVRTSDSSTTHEVSHGPAKNAIPERTTLFLLGLGLAGAAGAFRKRRNAPDNLSK
jgi:hypothetical protein